MRFDPFKFSEVKPNVELESPKGLLHVMCSQPVTVYVSCQGVEAIAGFGQEIRVQIADAFTFRIEGPELTRVFVEDPRSIYSVPTGEVFTNLDRKPAESGTMLAVQQALRNLKLQERSMLQTMRAAERRTKKRVEAEDRPDPADIPIAAQDTPAPDPDDTAAKPKAKAQPKDDEDAE